jgi:hypothetical protein
MEISEKYPLEKWYWARCGNYSDYLVNLKEIRFNSIKEKHEFIGDFIIPSVSDKVHQRGGFNEILREATAKDLSDLSQFKREEITSIDALIAKDNIQEALSDLTQYIKDWGHTFGRYYHTSDPYTRAIQVMDSPEEFVSKLKRKLELH